LPGDHQYVSSDDEFSSSDEDEYSSSDDDVWTKVNMYLFAKKGCVLLWIS